MEKYTVGQIAKSLGVSSQTLRHYESMGLIKSTRNDDNQYRTFSVSDTRILFMISIYRSMGFSLPVIKEMLLEMKLSGVKDSFSQRINEVDAEIQQLQLLKIELEEYRKGIIMAEERIGECWIEEKGHTMFSVMKSGSGFSLADEKDSDLLSYQKLAPHVRQGFVISKDYLTGNSQFDFQYGVFINRRYAEQTLNQDEINEYMMTLEGPIAKTIIELHGKPFHRGTFEPFLTWIYDHGYEMTSDVYGVARYHAYYEQEITLFEFLVSVRLRENSQNT